MSAGAFDCIICFKMANTPIQCTGCGMIFCQNCLYQFWAPNAPKCISCDSKNISPLSSQLMEEYEQLKNTGNAQKLPLVQAIQQQANIIQLAQNEKLGPCSNSPICKSNIMKLYEREAVCGPECLIFLSLNPLRETNQIDKMRMEIQRCLSIINEKKNVQIVTPQQQPVQVIGQIQRQNVGVTNFAFDLHTANIKVMGYKVSLAEDVYVFRSIVSNTGFTQGIHYWEISPDASTENEMKIGVSKMKNFDLNSGFSDYQFGYGYYTVGQLRNGSNANGKQFGARFKNKGVLGILLDMTKGCIAFSYDGQYLGVGFESKELLTGPIHPAVAMLHKAGFDYKVGIPIPQQIANAYFK